MRGFGDSDPLPLDATRGLADWADDTAALLDALDVTAPPTSWAGRPAARRSPPSRSTAPVASLTFLDPVSPYGYGGTHADGTPASRTAPARAAAGSTPSSSRAWGRATPPPTARPRRATCCAPPTSPSHRAPEPSARTCWSTEILKSVTGDNDYPGDSTASENWPGFAPGTRGILNALSGKHCNWAGIVDLDPKPPVLWTHGSDGPRRGRRLAVGDGHARRSSARSRAGPARRSSRRSRW